MIVRGVPLELHPSPDYLSDHIRESGDFFEADILDTVRDLLAMHPPGVLIDVGAMIGNHTAYFGAFVPHSAIHAFEPDPDNFALLRRNAPEAHLYQVALSSAPGLGRLVNYDPANRGHGQLSWQGSTTTILTLDSYSFRDVRLIKIDVEGHEGEVLRGADRTIATSRPLLLVEDWGGTVAHVIGDLGYRLAASWPDDQTYLWEPV